MTYASHVEFELRRAEILVRKDGRQRWVTMDGAIHESPVPFRDAISVYRMLGGAVVCNYRDRAPTNPAIGAL